MPGRVWEEAFEVAVNQYGFITFSNIRDMGADPARLRRWYGSGKIEKKGHGIYRFRQVPASPLDAYMLATLWPSGKGVLSHETALELHELCDIDPAKIHLTLPMSYRPRRKGAEPYVLYHERLDTNEIGRHEGIPIVTPVVAIRQAIRSAVPTDLIRQAIEAAGQDGRISSKQFAVWFERLEQRAQ